LASRPSVNSGASFPNEIRSRFVRSLQIQQRPSAGPRPRGQSAAPQRHRRAPGPAPGAEPGRLSGGLTLAQSSRGEPISSVADDSPRASDEETSGDAGRCTKSENFWSKAAFGNVEVFATAVWGRLNACRTPDRAPRNTNMHVPSSACSQRKLQRIAAGCSFWGGLPCRFATFGTIDSDWLVTTDCGA